MPANARYFRFLAGPVGLKDPSPEDEAPTRWSDSAITSTIRQLGLLVKGVIGFIPHLIAYIGQGRPRSPKNLRSADRRVRRSDSIQVFPSPGAHERIRRILARQLRRLPQMPSLPLSAAESGDCNHGRDRSVGPGGPLSEQAAQPILESGVPSSMRRTRTLLTSDWLKHTEKAGLAIEDIRASGNCQSTGTLENMEHASKALGAGARLTDRRSQVPQPPEVRRDFARPGEANPGAATRPTPIGAGPHWKESIGLKKPHLVRNRTRLNGVRRASTTPRLEAPRQTQPIFAPLSGTVTPAIRIPFPSGSR